MLFISFEFFVFVIFVVFVNAFVISKITAVVVFLLVVVLVIIIVSIEAVGFLQLFSNVVFGKITVHISRMMVVSKMEPCRRGVFISMFNFAGFVPGSVLYCPRLIVQHVGPNNGSPKLWLDTEVEVRKTGLAPQTLIDIV